MMPSTRESWEKHTKSGYYIGVSKEHYQCHKVYISSTRGIRVCETVFFKHKYLTQPLFTVNDALILAADNLATAINGAIPNDTATQAGIRQLLDIFKKQANSAKDTVTAQRVSMNKAAIQRVHEETEQANSSNARTATPAEEGGFKVEEYNTNNDLQQPQIPMVLQDKNNVSASTAPQRTRTRSTRSMTDKFLYHMMEIPGIVQEVTARATASRKYPMQFLCNYANAVVDGKTGAELEY